MSGGPATTVDAWGRVILEEDGWLDLLWSGGSIDGHLVADGPARQAYDAACAAVDIPLHTRVPAPLDHSPAEEHARRAALWHIPPEYLQINLRAFLRELCEGDAELARVEMEMDLFEARGLQPMLATMVYLVDTLRTRGIVWGVGRGSSVASFVLFKLGVHKIDALAYGLDIHEFLR